LRSAVEQALLLAPGAEIVAGDLLGATAPAATAEGAPMSLPTDLPLTFREAKDHVVGAFEREFLVQALRRHGGNISKAAEEVGMYRQNFQQKMRELGIKIDQAMGDEQ
jgi:two-component system response regulator GlrR